MKETSLDAYDDLLCSGKLGESFMTALALVEGNPDRTVKELLDIGVEDGVFRVADRNKLAPRITDLCREILIYRPYERKCSVTGRKVAVHRLTPPEWREKRQRLKRTSSGAVALHRLEVASKTKKNVYHTVVKWSDGSYSCTCGELYGRRPEHDCHHIKGMRLATTGLTPMDR